MTSFISVSINNWRRQTLPWHSTLMRAPCFNVFVLLIAHIRPKLLWRAHSLMKPFIVLVVFRCLSWVHLRVESSAWRVAFLLLHNLIAVLLSSKRFSSIFLRNFVNLLKVLLTSDLELSEANVSVFKFLFRSFFLGIKHFFYVFSFIEIQLSVVLLYWRKSQRTISLLDFQNLLFRLPIVNSSRAFYNRQSAEEPVLKN
jgi:hypothetical protein